LLPSLREADKKACMSILVSSISFHWHRILLSFMRPIWKETWWRMNESVNVLEGIHRDKRMNDWIAEPARRFHGKEREEGFTFQLSSFRITWRRGLDFDRLETPGLVDKIAECSTVETDRSRLVFCEGFDLRSWLNPSLPVETLE
jgi:hypothetical protein